MFVVVFQVWSVGFSLFYELCAKKQDGGVFYKRNQLPSPSFTALCCVLTRFFFKLRLEEKISPQKIPRNSSLQEVIGITR